MIVGDANRYNHTSSSHQQVASLTHAFLTRGLLPMLDAPRPPNKMSPYKTVFGNPIFHRIHLSNIPRIASATAAAYPPT